MPQVSREVLCLLSLDVAGHSLLGNGKHTLFQFDVFRYRNHPKRCSGNGGISIRRIDSQRQSYCCQACKDSIHSILALTNDVQR